MDKKNTGRIEKGSSRTAAFTCISRAASYIDKRECYSGTDDVAYTLIPIFFRLLLKFWWLFNLFKYCFFPKDIYEYVIARTNYFDVVFKDALEQQFDQVIIFGAGFDSRALRFNKINNGTRIFELDAPITQQEKMKAYQSKKIAIPDNLVFVPINFNKESLAEKITQAGFITGKRLLFMLEGVTMYLSRDAVESTFCYMADVSGKGSVIVFDYIHAVILLRKNKYYGEKNIYKTAAKVGEEWTFALEENEVEHFLHRYGFLLKDHSGTRELEGKFFRNSKGSIVGKINGTHAIVTGVKR